MKKLAVFFFLIAVFAMQCGALSFTELDHAVRSDFSQRRLATLDSLRHAPASSLSDKHLRLAAAFADFNVDSAVYHVLKAETLAPDSLALRRALLAKAGLFNSSLMMHKEAADIFARLRHGASDSAFLRDYYTLGVQLYRNLESLAPEQSMRRDYFEIKRAYRDSVLQFSDNSPLIQANAALDAGKTALALDILLPMISGSDYSPANGAVYHVIAAAYALRGETERQMEYLTLAARADLENGVREYLALPELALMLYEAGDVERAYHYMQRALDDAAKCNARVRLLGMASTMALVSDSYSGALRKANTRLWVLVALIGALMLVLAALFFFIRRRNSQLAAARLNVEQSLEALKMESRVKEKYINRFMNLSLDYLDKLERYRNELFKIASHRDFDRLYTAISSTNYVNREAESFYKNFDEAFLELYPDFVESFNALLRPEERIELRNPRHLNTDLRIFALMQLGITTSSDIARFLHCSKSTVYNYRTRYRAKALDPDAFDREIFPENL